MTPVLDAQDELVEAVHVLEGGLVGDREDDGEASPVRRYSSRKALTFTSRRAGVQSVQDGPLTVNVIGKSLEWWGWIPAQRSSGKAEW